MKPVNRWGLLLLVALLLATACREVDRPATALSIPRGYLATLEVVVDGKLYGFGPFVGYYFRPMDPADLSKVAFICLNERRFYTLDMPLNSRLFEGEAQLVQLPNGDFPLPGGSHRILPMFFTQAPAAWLATRPEPQDEYVHFHSLHNAAGAARIGYWLRHKAMANFSYDMGGRVGPDSPLYHPVVVGIDRSFARIIEFDRGPRVATH